MSAPAIEVAGAVIVRQGRILLAQRMPPRDYAYLWESPGGKLEPGESHRDAIARELREELGIEVHPGLVPDQPLASFKLLRAGADAPDIQVSLYFVGDRFEGTPTPREGQGLGWFTAKEMMQLELAPANNVNRWDVVRVVGRPPQ